MNKPEFQTLMASALGVYLAWLGIEVYGFISLIPTCFFGLFIAGWAGYYRDHLKRVREENKKHEWMKPDGVIDKCQD